MGATVSAQPTSSSREGLPGSPQASVAVDLGRDARVDLLIAGIALLAAAIQVVRVLRPGGLMSGGSYDTSVYLGSAVRLVHGGLPYRDFVLLQPPGLLLVLSPFALLSWPAGTAASLAALSAFEPVLAAANVLLVGRLVRHRGWVAALWACGLVAIYPAMYAALEDGQLEPLMDLVCLLGLSLAFRGDRLTGGRRMAAAGAVLGFAASILLAAAIPVMAVAAVSAARFRRRLCPLVAGVLAGFLLPVLPFFAAAPSAAFHDILLSAFQRARGSVRTPLPVRVHDLGFFAPPPVAVALLLVIGVIIVAALLLARRRTTALERFAALAVALMVAAQLTIVTYYGHYAGMLIPYVAILFGLCMARIARPRWMRRLLPVVAVAAGIAALTPLLVGFERTRWRDPAPYVDAAIPPGACAVAEHTQDLMAADRFVASRPGCPLIADPYGTYLAYADDHAEFISVMGAVLSRCDYLVTDSSLQHWLPAPWESPLRSTVITRYRPRRVGRLSIWKRDRSGGARARGG
jgi:alpha-1,2-mannosyltransferase